MKKTKKSFFELINFFLIMSIFVLNDYTRIFIYNHILKNNILKINILFFICCLVIVFKTAIINRYNFFILFLFFISYVLAIFSIISGYNYYDFNQITIVTEAIFIPLLLIGVSYNDNINIKIINLLLNIINLIVVSIIIIGIFDYFSNYKIQIFLRNYFFSDDFFIKDIEYNILNVYRYYSFLGHPLRLTGIILMFYSINNIYNKKINYFLLTILSLIGISLTNSKMGFLCLMILFLTSYYFNKKKDNKIILKLIIIFIIVFISYNLFNINFFQETIFKRFITTDITTGRSKIYKILLDNKELYPKIFGQGYAYSYYIKELLSQSITFNLEFPPLMFAYDYGILSTIFIYLIIMIYPIYIFIIRKQWFILINFICVFLQVNTHAGITVALDGMAQLCFYIYLLLLISNQILYQEKINNIDNGNFIVK